MSIRVLCVAIVLNTVVAQAGDPTVRFEHITGETNGIAAAFRDWHRVEIERQGGPGKSHGWWPWGLRAFDFDNDGVLDLLASHHGIPHSMLLRGRVADDGKFQFADVTKSLGIDHRDMPGADDRPWIWDFDGDGFLDIAGFSDESPPRSAWNRKGKEFAATAGPLFKPLSHPREIADLNGDGFLDLDGGGQGQWFYESATKTFRHDAKPRFALPAGIPDEIVTLFEDLRKENRFFRVDWLTHGVIGYDTRGYDPRPIDLDGDGQGDVVATGSGGYGAPYRARDLLRETSGQLADRTSALGLPESGAPILIRDLTGDGQPEILIVADKAGEKAGGLFVNDGGKSFRRVDGKLSAFLDRRGPYLLRAYPADFDNDGRPDLVLSNPRYGRTTVYHNRGDGDFAEVLTIANCWDSNPIALADFDRDGRVDLAVGVRPEKSSPGDIHLFLNRTPETGHYLSIAPRDSAPNPFAVDAVIEVYAAGELGKDGAKPVAVEKAHIDGTPVHVGVGEHTRCDIRVVFPGGATAVRENLAVDRRVTIAP